MCRSPQYNVASCAMQGWRICSFCSVRSQTHNRSNCSDGRRAHPLARSSQRREGRFLCRLRWSRRRARVAVRGPSLAQEDHWQRPLSYVVLCSFRRLIGLIACRTKGFRAGNPNGFLEAGRRPQRRRGDQRADVRNDRRHRVDQGQKDLLRYDPLISLPSHFFFVCRKLRRFSGDHLPKRQRRSVELRPQADQ